jgi:hypothetical protein
MGIIIFLLLVIIVILTSGWALVPIFAVLATWGTWTLLTIVATVFVAAVAGVIWFIVTAYNMWPSAADREHKRAYKRVTRKKPKESLEEYTARMEQAGVLPRHGHTRERRRD